MSRPEWIPDNATPDEKRLIREHVVSGADVEMTKNTPDSLPDLVLLHPSERPTVGLHFVVWGSKLLNDVRERPVKRHAVSEDEYAAKLRREAEKLIASGVKDPLHRGEGRADRAEKYARWRYKGFVCGEVNSL